MLKQMVNVSNAELDGWNEQVGRLQERKQDRRTSPKRNGAGMAQPVRW